VRQLDRTVGKMERHGITVGDYRYDDSCFLQVFRKKRTRLGGALDASGAFLHHRVASILLRNNNRRRCEHLAADDVVAVGVGKNEK